MSSATRRPRASGWQRSSDPWMTSTGQRTRPHSSSAAGRSVRLRPSRSAIIASGSVSSAQDTASSSCLVECGSGEQLVEEELDPRSVPALAAPERSGFASPNRWRRRRAPASVARLRRRTRTPASRRCPARSPRRPLIRSGTSAASRSAHGTAWQWAITTVCSNAGSVEHADQISADLVWCVAIALVRTVGAAGTRPVDGDHGEVARRGMGPSPSTTGRA